MTHRERILAACQGDAVDLLPWVPRLDLWYKARSYRGSLPPEVAGRSLRQIVDELGVGYHAVVPDFQDLRSEDDQVDRCLGIWRLSSCVHETQLTGVERAATRKGDATRVTYRTPVGSVSGAFEHTEDMRRAGVTIPWVKEHVLKSVDDVGPLAHIFLNSEVRPNEERLAEWTNWVGEEGLAVGFAQGAASPLHHVLHDLATMETFFLLLHDYPDEMARLGEAIGVWMERVLQMAARSQAKVIFWGGNYDAAITNPRFFEQHILAWLERAASRLHASGKLLLTHTDGENTGLTQYYRESGVNVADSICPAPMTRMSLAQAISEMPEITIWGGLPSIALVPEITPEDEFRRLLDETLALVQGRRRFILGVADTAPPEASWERIVRITEMARGL